MAEWRVVATFDEEMVYKIVEGMIAELKERKWGTAKLEVSAQGGNIVTIRRSVEQLVNLRK